MKMWPTNCQVPILSSWHSSFVFPVLQTSIGKTSPLCLLPISNSLEWNGKIVLNGQNCPPVLFKLLLGIRHQPEIILIFPWVNFQKECHSPNPSLLQFHQSLPKADPFKLLPCPSLTKIGSWIHYKWDLKTERKWKIFKIKFAFCRKALWRIWFQKMRILDVADETKQIPFIFGI
jgi:hypothetical protein